MRRHTESTAFRYASLFLRICYILMAKANFSAIGRKPGKISTYQRNNIQQTGDPVFSMRYLSRKKATLFRIAF
jgi:hypothetical protein